MESFIRNQNVMHFVELLEDEADSIRRSVLQKLLVEEENRFAKRSEQLDMADAFIVRGRERIRRQRELVERLRGNGHDCGPAEQTLANFVTIQTLFESYRSVVVHTLE